MAYSHTTWVTLRQQLALRLSDTSNIYWTDAEIGLYLGESFRTFALLSGFWRERTTFNTVASTVFYDLAALSILDYTITDRVLINFIQLHFLESTASQSSWGGTEMFTLDDLRYALQRRRDQFLSDTGCRITRSTQAVTAGATGRVDLTDTIVDVRRAAWQNSLNYYATLWRDDERLLTALGSSWMTQGVPEKYSIMAPPPITLQLAPPAAANGTLELLTVDSGAALNPASSATLMGVPDNLVAGVKWGAMSDLLSKDGPARDPARADYCEKRYQQFVQLARLLPILIHCEISGTPIIPDSLQEVDSLDPNWQNKTGTPSKLVLAGYNLVALSPVPSSVLTITVDVVKNAPVPSADGTQVQLGREQLDMILDYAEHLALFKVGGEEFAATEIQANNFLLQSLTYNHRISAAARAVFDAADQSSGREEARRPRRRPGVGIGALRS